MRFSNRQDPELFKKKNDNFDKRGFIIWSVCAVVIIIAITILLLGG